MRNLKKFLALVLALMMVVSVMVTVSAADFSSTPDGTEFGDDASITKKYDEAVQVLEGLKVLQGDAETGNLRPQSHISRAEMAAIAYRVTTGKTEAKSPDVYAGSKFTDVPASHWAYGFINWCNDNHLIVGDPDGDFRPDDEITGYEVITILLRALGYGKRGELEGNGYDLNAAKLADDAGITANIGANELSKPATREMVADMTFRAIAKASKVSVTVYPTVGYAPTYHTLGLDVFGLAGKVYEGFNKDAAYIADAAHFATLTTHVGPYVDGEYDAPITIWYTGCNNASLANNQIEVTYQPVFKSTKAVTNGELYSAMSSVDTDKDGKITIPNTRANVDGKPEGSDTEINNSNGKKNSAITIGKTDGYTGNGVLTELYVVDGNPYLTVVNTYVDTTNGESGDPWKLTTATEADQDDPDAESDVAKGTVVIFHKYNTTGGVYAIDTDTIHAAKVLDMTIANTYDTGVAGTSSFVSNTGTYQYDAKFGGYYLADDILNRDDLMTAAKNELRQNVYFDDYGYVMYTAPWQAAPSQSGYLLLRSGGYEHKVADNWWAANFEVIMPDGTNTTVSGAVNGTNGHYDTQAAASSANAAVVGLYSYTIYGNLYQLQHVDARGTADVNGYSTYASVGKSSIVAGVGRDSTVQGTSVDNNIVCDNETVYFIAQYESATSNKIVGYQRVVGVKNIGTLTARSMAGAVDGTSGLLTREYVYKNGIANLVFIRNAAVTPTTVVEPKTEKVFYLLDAVSHSNVDATYDTHSVVGSNGKADWNFEKAAVTSVPGVADGKFYTYTGTANGYYTGVAKLADSKSVTYAGAGILAVGAPGSEEFINLADNCVIYAMNGTSKVTTGAIGDLKGLVNGTADGTPYANAVVGATNEYGWATVLYLSSTAQS